MSKETCIALIEYVLRAVLNSINEMLTVITRARKQLTRETTMNDAATKLHNLLLTVIPSHRRAIDKSIEEMKRNNLSDDLICLQLAHMLVNVYYAIANHSPVDTEGYGWAIDEGTEPDG